MKWIIRIRKKVMLMKTSRHATGAKEILQTVAVMTLMKRIQNVNTAIHSGKTISAVKCAAVTITLMSVLKKSAILSTGSLKG